MSSLMRWGDVGINVTVSRESGPSGSTILGDGITPEDSLFFGTSVVNFIASVWRRRLSDVNDVAISDGDAPTVVAATRVGLYYSQLGGKWSAKPAGLPVSTVSAVLFGDKADSVYAVEYGRLYQSNDRAASWSELRSSLPLTRIRQLWRPFVSSTRIFGMTGELGIIYRD